MDDSHLPGNAWSFVPKLAKVPRTTLSRRSAWSSQSTERLFLDYAEPLELLRAETADAVTKACSQAPLGSLPLDDVFLLRHLLEATEAASKKKKNKGGGADEEDGASAAAAKSVFEALEWRSCSEGRSIVEAAAESVAAATANGGWDNDQIFARAPHGEKISPFISPKGTQLITLSTGTSSAPYLVKVIRAGSINDKGLMQAVTPDQLVDFFLFSTEVNALAADALTRRSGSLVKVATANDLSGVDLFGDSTFRNALSSASKQANALYPSLAGTTILLNLPRLLSALVGLFKPLFPPAVQRKLKFAQGPLAKVKDLTELAPTAAGAAAASLTGGATTSEARAQFLKEIDSLLD